MIINSNIVELSDSGLELEQTIITMHTSSISNNNTESVKIDSQIGFFLNPAKMFESVTNALKIKGFDKDKIHLKFDYPIVDRNVFYFFDLKLKEYLLQLFPEWDESKLILTTEPIAE